MTAIPQQCTCTSSCGRVAQVGQHQVDLVVLNLFRHIGRAAAAAGAPTTLLRLARGRAPAGGINVAVGGGPQAPNGYQ